MKIVGVTKCPAGLAHTYIAAELLEQTAQSLGHEIIVETQGATGRENELSEVVIKDADIVVLAIDVEIEERERFDGKRVVELSIMEFIGNPDALFESLLEKGQIQNEPIMEEENETIDEQFLKPFLTGITFISPFLVALGVGISVASLFQVTSIDVKYWSTIAYQVIFIIFCGKVSEQLSGHYAIAPVVFAAIYLSMNHFGFGAIVLGILITYIYGMIWRKIQTIKLSRELSRILPLYIYPIIGTLICVSLAYVANPIGIYISKYYEILLYILSNNFILLGIVVIAIVYSLIIGIGTKINKLVYSFAVISLMTSHFEIMAIVAVTIGLPALSLWVASFLHQERLDIDKKMRKKLLSAGVFGLTEPLFEVISRKDKQSLIGVLIGTICAALVVSYFNVGVAIPNGGLLPIIIGVSIGRVHYLLAIITGILVTNILFFIVKKEG